MMGQSKLGSLKTFLANSGEMQALKDGSIQLDSHGFEFIELSPAPVGMRRMTRELEFDVSEMAISTYICARDCGIPIIGLPVFFLRRFHHSMVSYNVHSGIQSPGDLRGKRFGARSYTFTPAVWARGILDIEFGVSTQEMTCVRGGDEHVQQYVYPSNVEMAPEGKDIETMLAEGTVDAAVTFNPVDSPNVKLLFPDAENAAITTFKNTGIFPADHMVVVKEETLKANPTLAPALFEIFKASRDQYLSKIASEEPQSGPAQLMAQHQAITGGHPIPYGLEQNRRMLDAMIQFCVDQKIATKMIDVEELFPTNTLSLE